MTRTGGALAGAAAIGLLVGALAAALRALLGATFSALAADRSAGTSAVLVAVVLLPALGATAGRLLSGRGSDGSEPVQDFADPQEPRGAGGLRALRRLGGCLLTVTTGGSAGCEGALAWTGTAAGSALGRWLRLGADASRVLGACGVAAAIGGLLQAPIAGVFFAAEVALGSYRIRSLVPVGMAAFAGSFVPRIILGRSFSIAAPDFQLMSPLELPIHLLVGFAAAFVGFALAALIRRSAALHARLGGPRWLQPAIGGLVAGALGAFWPVVRGAGYPSIPTVFLEDVSLQVALVWLLAKTAATSATLGSGGVGGLIGPSLILGACLGRVVGGSARLLLPQVVAHPSSYAIVGIAAMVAVVARAPMAAVFLALEWSGNYLVVLPATVAVVGAVLLRSLSERRRERDSWPGGGERGSVPPMRPLRDRRVKELLRRSRDTVTGDTPTGEVLRRLRLCRDGILMVTGASDGEAILGVISAERWLPLLGGGARQAGTARELAMSVATLRVQDTLERALAELTRSHLPALPVVDGQGRVEGVVTRYDVMDVCATELLRGYVGVGDSRAEGQEDAPHQHEVCAVPVPRPFRGRTLREIDLGGRWGVTCIGLRSANQNGDLTPLPLETGRVLRAGEVLILAGDSESIERIRLLERASEPPAV